MSRMVITTIIGADFLAHARVLGNSIREHHPEIEYVVLVADTAGKKPQDEPFSKLSLDDLDIASRNERLFLYTEKGVLASIKPDLILHLLHQGFSSVLYLDADMLLLDRIDDILRGIDSHSLTITPHLRSADHIRSPLCPEQHLLLAGIYNGGFIGASANEETLAFLRWWAGRLEKYCVCDMPEGIHFDQRWLDFAPSYVGNVNIIRDPGINVAYWNLQESDPRSMTKNGLPCRLFHFSGFDPIHPDRLTIYHPEFKLADHPPLVRLCRDYQVLLLEAGFSTTRNAAWPWHSFSNGKQIKGVHRHSYKELREAGHEFGDPFDAHGYLQWLQGLEGFFCRCRYHLRRLKQNLRSARQRRRRKRQQKNFLKIGSNET